MALAAFAVPILESERGWGSKIDDQMLCLTKEDAQKWATEFNSYNTSDTAPDWYMMAMIDGVHLVEITPKQLKILNKDPHKRMLESVLNNLIK